MRKTLFEFDILIFIIDFLMYVNAFTYQCIHDDITSQHNFSVHEFNYRISRNRRNKLNTSLVPLNIHVYFDIDSIISKDVVFNVDFALKRAVEFLSETIKVKGTINPFVLDRTSCSQMWRHGVNQGKCSRLKPNREFCSTKETNFIIPNQYLNKLDIYDNNASDPIYSIEKGLGAENSNFILFVISKSTSWCQRSDVQAYGSYCRLDKSNRPIAGLLNLCPENLSKKLYKPHHYFNIVMHELFHILGFSKHLYSKFKTCNSIYDCEIPKKITSLDQNGIHRLTFPDVVKSMQAHFNCTNDEFGGPLEKSLDSSTDKYTSHWHPLLMYSSIMTPSIQQEDYVVIDNITLALLASTGWYQIDFSKAQSFIFGKDEGCNFGENCTNSKYLCQPGNNTGCDINYQTIGNCEQISSDHPCGIYKPNKEESCVEEEGKLYGLDWKSRKYERRCVFLPHQNNSLLRPTCIVLSCKNSNFMNLLLDGNWINCGLENQFQTENVTMNCPNQQLFCISKGLEMSESICSDKDYGIYIEVIFESPSKKNISSDKDNFKSKTIEAIASQIGIPVDYITKSSLKVFKSILLEFVICPPPDLEQSKLESLMEKTNKFLKESSYMDIYKGAEELPVSAIKIRINTERALNFSDHQGFQALIIVPVICAVFLITTFIASVIRHISIQKHRPKRDTIAMPAFSEMSFI